MKKSNPVVHFELPAEDGNRMADFYTRAFGWQMMHLGPQAGDYIVVTTTPVDETGRPVMPGAINGGLFPKAENPTLKHPSMVIAVDDIQEAMKEITAAGGKLLGEPVELQGIGLYLTFEDTEQNRLSILQPMMHKAEEC